MSQVEKLIRASVGTGLDSMNYRIGRRDDFVRVMTRSLRTRAELDALVSPDPADPTKALIDAWATSLDVLAFYQARIADGNYLTTAKDNLTVQRLASQVGYRPAPPVAAMADIAFLTDDANGAPHTVEIPIGTKIQSQPGANELPQTYETIEPVTAYRAWNAIPVRKNEFKDFRRTTYRFAGVSLDIKVGDSILFIAEDTIADLTKQNFLVRKVKSVLRVPEDDAVEVEIDSGLTGNVETNPSAFIMRVRAAIFGYNALPWASLTDGQKYALAGDDMENNPQTRYWVEAPYTGRSMDLDAAYPTVTGEGYAVVWSDYTYQLHTVRDVYDRTASSYLMSGKVTGVNFGEDIDPNTNRRSGVVLINSQPLKYAPLPMGTPLGIDSKTESLTLDHIDFDRDRPLQLPKKLILAGKTYRMLIQEGPATIKNDEGILLKTLSVGDEVRMLIFHIDPVAPETSKILVVTEDGIEGNLTAGDVDLMPPHDDDPVIAITVTPKPNQDGAKKYELLIDPPLQYLIYRPTAVVYGNVATATHGETRNEPLGNGDGRVAFPRFTLRSKPLTYLATGSSTGVEPALKVTVNDIEWHRTDTLYSANPNDRSFVLRPQLDGTSVVEFGDGINGSRLPTGSENVRATYRSGGGAAGRVRAEQLKILLNKPLGLKTALNPAASIGGTDGETPDAIRHNAPAFTRSLRRIVSLEDLEDFARRFPGVGKAQVDLLWNGNRQVAHLTVASPTANAFDIAKLSAAIDDARDPRFPVVIQPGRILRFALKVEVLVTPDYDRTKVLAAVTQSLLDTFSFERRAFSEAVTTSEVAAAAHAVAGVLSVRTTDLRSVFAAATVEDPLRALPARYESGVLKPADLYLIEPTMLTTEEHRDV